jgi:hypothetical protein
MHRLEIRLGKEIHDVEVTVKVAELKDYGMDVNGICIPFMDIIAIYQQSIEEGLFTFEDLHDINIYLLIDEAIDNYEKCQIPWPIEPSTEPAPTPEADDSGYNDAFSEKDWE